MMFECSKCEKTDDDVLYGSIDAMLKKLAKHFVLPEENDHELALVFAHLHNHLTPKRFLKVNEPLVTIENVRWLSE